MTLVSTRIFVGVAGGLLLVVGTGLMFQPHDFSAANGIMVGDNPSQLSEIRAPGALLIISALFMLFSIGRARLLEPALVLITGIYGSYGLARLLSLMIDGPPVQSLFQAMILELVIAGLGMIAWQRFRSTQTSK
ncbi:MAG: DUF4345 domain-containing protein [Pseudomonadota bacterium]